jgi:hypothetical protein
MSDLTPKAKDIIAKEIIESTSQSFFAYVACQSEEFRKVHGSQLVNAFALFTNEVWAQVVDDFAKEKERLKGR